MYFVLLMTCDKDGNTLILVLMLLTNNNNSNETLIKGTIMCKLYFTFNEF